MDPPLAIEIFPDLVTTMSKLHDFPKGIKTLSEEAGTPDGLQFEAAFQLPVAGIKVRSTACTPCICATIRKNRPKYFEKGKCLTISRLR